MRHAWFVLPVALAFLPVVACGGDDDDANSGGGAGTSAGSGGSGTSAGTGGTSAAGTSAGGTSAGGTSTGGDSTILGTSPVDPDHIVATASDIYFTATNGNSIFKVALSGGTPQQVVATAPGSRGLAVTDAIYWYGQGYTLNSAALDGSGAKVLFTSTHETSQRIAVSGGSIYFLDRSVDGTGGLKSVPTAGAATAAAVGALPSGVFPDDIVAWNKTGVFYSGENAGALTNDLVYTSYDGATVKTVAGVPIAGGSIGDYKYAADDDALYYILAPATGDPAVMRAPIDGSGPKQLFTHKGSYLVTTGGKLYFAVDNLIDVADASGTVSAFYSPSTQSASRVLTISNDLKTMVWVTGESVSVLHKQALLIGPPARRARRGGSLAGIVKVTHDPRVFLDDPVGRCFVGRRHLVFVHSPTFVGFSSWGEPDERDVHELLSLAAVGLRPEMPPQRWLVDLRALETIFPTTFGPFVEYVQVHAPRLRETIVRQAQLRPPGLAGAIIAGFAQIARPPYPERVFGDLEEALGWLGVERSLGLEVLAEIDAARVTSLAVHPIVGRLRAVLVTDGPLNLSQASRRLGLSARSLQRALAEGGTSHRAEVKTFQVERAKELLRQDRETITWIAAEVGFSSVQHFATAFRRETGETPGSFRMRNVS